MKVLFLFLFFFTPVSLASSLFKNRLVIAQDKPVFDDSDLADIEGSDIDEDLEEQFDTFDEEEEEDNFDEEDFEVIDEEEEEEDENEEEEEEVPDPDELELISDRPGYEVISDKELEEEFDDEDTGDLDDSAVPEEITEEEPEDDLAIPEEITEEEPEDDSAIPEEITEEEPEDDSAIPEEITEEEPEDDSAIPEEITEEEPEDDSAIPEEITEEELEDDSAIPEEITEEELEDDSAIQEEFDFKVEEEIEDVDREDDIAVQEEVDFEMDSVQGESLNLISNIRYLVDKDQIIIDCSEPSSYQVRKNEETNQFIIEILQAKLADNLHWPYVLRDFKTKFALIKADQKDSSTVRVVIQLKEGADFPQSTLTENGDQIVMGYGQVMNYAIVKKEDTSDNVSDLHSILPAKTLEDLYFKDIKFSGNPISFHVIDAPVKQVLRFISEESGLNMVIGDKVEGTVTLKLEDVPWDQALHTIFKVKSLGYTRDGNVITILTLADIEKRTNKLKEISDRRKSLSPYKTKVIPVNYGKISEIESKVKDFSTPGSAVSKGGQIIVHPESNTFVVIDTSEVIEKIESLVQYLDKPPKQVMVEAKIVEAAENFSRNFGLSWGLGGNLPVTINASGFLNLFRNISASFDGQLGDKGGGSANLNVSGLPIIGDISASLKLAETDNYAKVISSPKMVVISGKTASITRNSPILIKKSEAGTVDANEGGNNNLLVQQSTFEPLDVAISLTVTPTVTTTGSVFLQVDVTRTDPGPRS